MHAPFMTPFTSPADYPPTTHSPLPHLHHTHTGGPGTHAHSVGLWNLYATSLLPASCRTHTRLLHTHYLPFTTAGPLTNQLHEGTLSFTTFTTPLSLSLLSSPHTTTPTGHTHTHWFSSSLSGLDSLFCLSLSLTVHMPACCTRFLCAARSGFGTSLLPCLLYGFSSLFTGFTLYYAFSISLAFTALRRSFLLSFFCRLTVCVWTSLNSTAPLPLSLDINSCRAHSACLHARISLHSALSGRTMHALTPPLSHFLSRAYVYTLTAPLSSVSFSTLLVWFTLSPGPASFARLSSLFASSPRYTFSLFFLCLHTTSLSYILPS